MAVCAPRVWVACLASYNAGRLVGEWADATDVDELEAARDRVGAKAIVAAKQADEWPVYFGTPEEFAIHDYDGFPNAIVSQLGEYPDWKLLADIGRLLVDHGNAFAAYLEACEVDLADVDEDSFTSKFRGQWESEEDYAYDYLESVGIFGGAEPAIPEDYQSYFDVKAWARDNIFQHGNHTFVTVGGAGYVFDREG